MADKSHAITVEVHATPRHAQVPARLSLVDWLRDELRLTSRHVGCEHGVRGACSVMLDDDPVRACLMYTVQADAHRITTVEDLAHSDHTLRVLWDSFAARTDCNTAVAPPAC